MEASGSTPTKSFCRLFDQIRRTQFVYSVAAKVTPPTSEGSKTFDRIFALSRVIFRTFQTSSAISLSAFSTPTAIPSKPNGAILKHNDLPDTVPIRRNLTGNAWQNGFCFRSARVPVPVLYPFRSHSVSVLYPFRSRSLSVPSVSALETRSEERCYREPVCKNAVNKGN